MNLFSYGLQLKDYCNSLYGVQSLNEVERFNSLIHAFSKSFKTGACHIASSSGRMEIVGNHTDHNGGRVLASTISKDIVACFMPSNNGKIVIKSKGYKDILLKVDRIEKRETNSRGLVAGVLKGFVERGYKVGGFNAVISGNIKSGAGMSSSAAFEMLVAQIVNHLYNDGLVSASELAIISQYAENVYFNKPCGLLDQSVIALGGVVELDFSNRLAFNQVENAIEGLEFVVVDSGGSHANLTPLYKAIPDEMKLVAEYLGKNRLIDVEPNYFLENFEKISSRLGERPALRAKHFFEENERVKNAVMQMQAGDGEGFLQTVNSSGQSSLTQLQNCDYEGSDRAIVNALKNAQKFNQNGAVRVHGGGFQGTILCVVRSADLPNFVENMSNIYTSKNVHVLKIRSVGTTVL